MHEGHVAQRLLPVLAGARVHEADEKREDADDDAHHCASMMSERRKAMTVVVLFGIERHVCVAGKSRVSAMRGDDFVQHPERAVVAIRRGRADAPESRREEHVALDETLRLQFVA